MESICPRIMPLEEDKIWMFFALKITYLCVPINERYNLLWLYIVRDAQSINITKLRFAPASRSIFLLHLQPLSQHLVKMVNARSKSEAFWGWRNSHISPPKVDIKLIEKRKIFNWEKESIEFVDVKKFECEKNVCTKNK